MPKLTDEQIVRRRKPKRVRCWMVVWADDSKEFVDSLDRVNYAGKYFPNQFTITPGYFVPDEPKPKKRSKHE